MEKKKPYLFVILIQAIYAGMFLVSKAAFNGGMNSFIFTFYRQGFATLFLVPISLAFEWKNAPPLSFVTFCKIFFLSLFGISFSLDLSNVALVYTSATLAAATANCLPAITFFLALLFRMEVLKLKTIAGVAKLVGILICVGGAATLAFYTGPQVCLMCHHNVFGHLCCGGGGGQQIHNAPVSSGKTWIKGCFIMLSSNTCFGLWLILQGFVLKSYPSKLPFTTLQCLLSSVQSFVIAIAVQRDLHEWVLGWNLRLLSVAYCGIIVTAFTFYLQAWVVKKKGPVFLAMSTPLGLIFTTVASVILLCEVITLGRILGGLLLIGGLYAVLWGKNREQNVVQKSFLPSQVDKRVINSDGGRIKDAVTTKTPSPLSQ